MEAELVLEDEPEEEKKEAGREAKTAKGEASKKTMPARDEKAGKRGKPARSAPKKGPSRTGRTKRGE